MKNIILKIPTFAFIGLFLGSIWFAFQFRKSELSIVFDSCVIAIAVLVWFWTVSVADYMSYEAKNKTLLLWIYILTSLEALLYLVVNLSFFEDTVLSEIQFFPYACIFPLINAVLLSILIKKVFYARSWYFVFIEVFIIPVGMITLTPDIQAWEKSDKT